MAKLECPCGFLHDLDPRPDAAWLTIPDSEYDEMVQEIIRYHRIRDKYREEIQTEFGRAYECLECGRLRWARPREAKYRVFLPELQ